VKPEIILSEDGSHTLFVPELCEHYHSVHGAMQESRHVFINAGLKACKQEQLNVLEIGFGTGLNALLTFYEAEMSGLEINYMAYEPFPLGSEIWQELNHWQFIDHAKARKTFDLMHASEWGRGVALSEKYMLQKIALNIEQAILPENYFNLVYFDAFAPAIQPELWTLQIFSKIYQGVAADGILVTYSAMGEVRRNLKQAGFIVERLPGPPGKREMLRAWKRPVSSI
jgi:tRNA U34 5-methylaminomethyl-2-thiouridine-forming methyltransferase MnmC